jgi:acyl-CoA reductase-like NAD-dependent aldehyde dehydrogenase
MVQGVEIDSDGCLVNTNPATGEIISRVRCTTPDEIDEMVLTATRAQQKAWRTLSCTERVTLLKDGLKALESARDELVKCMVSEMGKPIVEANEEMDGATSKDEFMNILLDTVQPKKFGTSTVVRSPFGVVAILSPWNFPVDEILLLALPSLASGNTVIVKPSEVVPMTGALLVKTLQTVLPPGVIQLAQGAGDVGAQLVNHPGIALVAMTGSSATGRKILEKAAPQLKRIILEMGGKDPMIVFDDADLEKAAKDAVQFSLCNSGQVCCSVERIYVAESIYEKFQEMTKVVATEYKVGNGMDPRNKVGPLVSLVQRDQVQQQVDDAVSKGAKLLLQSDIPKHVNPKCSFYPVTVLADVDESMDISTKETFGPVVAMTKFDGSEEEAVKLANKTEYGLGSSVYTKDLDKAQRVASLIDAGQVGINCYPLENMDVHCPWVGHKQSGFGYHSGDGFLQFSIPKTIVSG